MYKFRLLQVGDGIISKALVKLCELMASPRYEIAIYVGCESDPLLVHAIVVGS